MKRRFFVGQEIVAALYSSPSTPELGRSAYEFVAPDVFDSAWRLMKKHALAERDAFPDICFEALPFDLQ